MRLRLKHVARLNARALREDESDELAFRYVDIAAVGRGRLTGEPQRMSFADAPSRARRLVSPGDTIISTVRTYLRAVWPVSGEVDDLVVSTGFTVVSPGPRLDGRFLGWWAQSDLCIEEVVARSVGVSYPAVGPTDIGDLPIELPSLATQGAIADFLDTETARIDAVIEKKRQLGVQLDRRTKAVVAATIASRGRTGLLGRFGRVLRGTTFPHRYQGRTAGDIPFFKVADMAAPGNEIVLRASENWISEEDVHELGAHVIPRGSVAFPRVGAALLLNPRRILEVDGIVDDNVLAFVPHDGDSRFWRYWLSTIDLAMLANPGPVPSVTESQLRTLRAPVLSNDEQKIVADELDEQTKAVAALLERLGRQRTLLAEHRQALITAAVSGQLDVAKAAA